MAAGLLQLAASGLQQGDQFTTQQPSETGEHALSRHFPAGAGQPVTVIGNAAQSAAIRSAFAGVRGITEVADPETKDGLVMFDGTLAAVPDSAEAQRTVERVRAAVHAVPGANAKAGGQSAMDLDIDESNKHDNRLIIPLVLAVVLIILALLLRSLVAPLLLIATVVLSFAAALGISALIFRHVFGFAHQDTSFPLYVFVFLVALGIDYNIFLMTRVREETAQHGTRRGALIGLGATGGVITSAGVVLAGTFAALGTLPLVAFAEIGFAVAFGVLLDTLVVRSVLVTALTLDVGRAMWWPGKLFRRGDHDPQHAAPAEEKAENPVPA
jgi:RND superfamily putative drug exporter